uniref:Uncharacterized protein n=1 Tax=Rhizophora mucronata TaxID=61149 RepID=A0A2P2PZ56_RHIMU
MTIIFLLVLISCAVIIMH